MALRLRLVIAVFAFVLTLALAVGAFVVLPVNHLVDEELGRQAKAQARLAADLVAHGGMVLSPPNDVVDGRPIVDQGPFSVRPDDWDRRLDPDFVRVVTGGGRAFAVVPAGDGRLVGAGVVRDDAIERREALGLALSVLLVLAAFVGWALWTGGAHARRLGALARVARRVADGDFSARAQLRGRDEVAQLGADVDRMAERLGALERARGEFVAKVSHDLRTPLTIIKGFAYTLERRAADPADAQRLAAIGRESDRLAALVDDLLTLSQAGAGVLRMQHVRFRVADLLAEVAERVDVLAAGLGVVVETRVRGGEWLVGDRRRLAQVLTNLATNATRHTPPGGRIVLTADVAADGSAELGVVDDGVGIDEAAVPRLLRPFECAGPSAGAGLGLAIASELVQAHGGSLDLSRRPAGGTHARARIPALRPALVES